MTFGNDQTVQYSYDKFDRTTKEQYNNVTYEYAYDASGQLAKQTSTAGEEYNYEYDSNGRLVKILDSGSSTTTRATYGYDQQGQLTSATVGGTSYTYTYDTAGNIQSKKVGSTTTNYTYGNSAWRDLLTAYNGGSITYSGGNPTKYYDGSTFTWTQGRRLATAKVDGTNISYTYDMAGVRSSKTVGSTKYDFTTLSGLVTRQTGGGKTIDFVYDENNQPLAMKYNNTLYYYVLNAQGDVVRIVNSSRSVVASYTYDPWGKIISSSGTLADINPLRYRGYYYDSETGFYYLQSRYYDPEIGRFINADSYASTDATGLLSTNMFAYCENDPVNRSDPDGEFWNIVAGAALGAGMEVLTQLATDTKLRDINWVDVAVQGAVGAASSFTIGFKVASKALNLAVNIVKNVGVSTVAETINQNINRSKSKGKTAAVGAQAAIDTLVDRGSAWLVGSTKAKAAKIIVKTVKNTFSFTFGISIETLFSRHHSRYASGR